MPRYVRTTWVDSPSTSTPINAANLNNIEVGLTAASLGYDLRWNPPYGVTLLMADEFNNNSISGSWSQIDVAGGSSRVTWTESADALTALTTGSDTSLDHAMVYSHAVGVGETVETCVNRTGNPGQAYNYASIFIADSNVFASANVAYCQIYNNGTYPAAIGVVASSFNGASPSTSTNFPIPYINSQYMRVKRSATNTYDFSYSQDGTGWIAMGSLSKTMTPAYIGVGAGTAGGTGAYAAAFEYVRCF